jgi:ribosomal protein S18 acetylase RimI-like enzyme
MIIRRAKNTDSEVVARLLFLAMKEIVFKFIGIKSPEKALLFLNSLVVQKENQYSYQNCWVAEIENKVIGMACVYDGANLRQLRKPIEATLLTMFGKPFEAEDETEAGEYYIDCIGVDPGFQGKGIGSEILKFLIEEYVHKQNQTLGLLVETANPGAKKLYLRSGFVNSGNKTLTGKSMEHMQYLPG